MIAVALRQVLSSAGDLEVAEGRLKNAAKRLADRIVARRTEIIAAAVISQGRLDETAQAISQHVLGETNDVFPFLLRPEMLASEAAESPRTLTFSGVRKAPYTEPLLEPAAHTESSMYNEPVTTWIARGIVATHLETNNIAPLRVDTQENFLEDIRTAASSLRESDSTPLLLLPRYDRPEVASVWRYLRQDPAQTQNLPVRRASPTDAKGIAGYFHDVPAYTVPLNRSCFVVAKEDFGTLRYAPHAGGACVGVSAQPQGADKSDLTFEWNFASSRTP